MFQSGCQNNDQVEVCYFIYKYSIIGGMSHHQHKITGDVFRLFNQVQKLTNVNKAIIFELIKIFLDHPGPFSQAIEQAFLKIFKSCHTKTNKKIPAKFETLVETLFRQLLNFQNENWDRDKPMKDAIKLLNNFLQLCVEAIYSSIMNIRIMASRITFLLVKLIPQNSIHKVLLPQVQDNFASAILHLLRLRVSTYRQLGAKLSSMVQHLQIQKIKQIQNQLFKIASLDDNDQIRKMVITNIIITKDNIDRILVRLRDRNAEIRAIIIKKLQSEKYTFSQKRFSLSQIYKLLYDGYGSKEIIVKKQCINYFVLFFDTQGFQSVKKGRKSANKSSIAMDIEPNKENKGQNQTNERNEQRFNRFIEFVDIFQPNLLMINPHLYTLFDSLIKQILEELPAELMALYIQNLCLKMKSCFNNPGTFDSRDLSKLSKEIIWMKHCIKCQIKEISVVFEELCPTGTELGKLLLIFVERQELYGTYQLLQYFEKQTHQIPDQIGRNKMFDSLKSILYSLKYFSPLYSPQILLRGRNQQKTSKVSIELLSPDDDICTIPQTQQLITQKLMLSYYNLPIVSSSLDLIEMLAQVMKGLRPDHYQIEMKEIMAEWNNPEQNTLGKQKEIIISNINKIEQSKRLNPQKKDESLLNSLYEKLNTIEIKIEQDKEKTRMMVVSISKLQPNSDIEMYMPIIKEHLRNNDQSQGLILLGLYCLQSLQKAKNFLPLYWHHLCKHNLDQTNNLKNHLLVSLRVVTDFVIKFDIIRQKLQINFQDAEQEEYNADLFMENIFQLMLHQESQVRILAIQSLCRMLYHDRIDGTHTSVSLMYLLLLWWSTDNQIVTAKSVHTISVFVKCYVDQSAGKGNNLHKLSEGFCIFFKLIMKYHKEGKVINKNKIIYNLKLDEFMRKAISIAINVLKFKMGKQKGKSVPMRHPLDKQDGLKPQQLFVLFLLQEPGFENILDKAFSSCDFYESSSLQTLVLVKQKLQKIKLHGKVNKKNQPALRKFEEQIDEQMKIKNAESYNHEQFSIIDSQLSQNIKIFQQEARRIAKNIQKRQIFIKKSNDDSDDDQHHQNLSDQNQDFLDQNELEMGQQQKQKKPSRKRKPNITETIKESQDEDNFDQEINQAQKIVQSEDEGQQEDEKLKKKNSKKPNNTTIKSQNKPNKRSKKVLPPTIEIKSDKSQQKSQQKRKRGGRNNSGSESSEKSQVRGVNSRAKNTKALKNNQKVIPSRVANQRKGKKKSEQKKLPEKIEIKQPPQQSQSGNSKSEAKISSISSLKSSDLKDSQKRESDPRSSGANIFESKIQSKKNQESQSNKVKQEPKNELRRKPQTRKYN